MKLYSETFSWETGALLPGRSSWLTEYVRVGVQVTTGVLAECVINLFSEGTCVTHLETRKAPGLVLY